MRTACRLLYRLRLVLPTWSMWQWALGAVAVTCGAFVQASVGFGFALIAAPFLVLISPELVPGPMLASSCVLSAGIALREHRHVDRRVVGWTLLGRVPGVWLGAVALALVSETTMELLFGASVLLGVAMSVSGLRVEPTTPVMLGAGLVSGVMGTMSSIGGPPIALLNQHQEGPSLRATLCAYFTVGCLMSIAGLALVGRFGLRELLLSLLMLPAIGVGFMLAKHTHRWLDGGRTRKGVWVVAVLSAIAVIIKAVRSM